LFVLNKKNCSLLHSRVAASGALGRAGMTSNIYALFPIAEAAFLDEKSVDKALLQLLETLVDAVRREGVFSDNELVEDVNTSDLRFILAEFMLGQACIRRAGRENRLGALNRGRAHLERFLASARRLGVFDKAAGEEETEKQYLDRVAAGRAYQGPSREVKIERFKQQKAAKAALEQMKDKKDEATQRAFWAERIRLACLEALDDVDSACKEIEVLEFASRAAPEELERARQQKAAVSDAGIEVTRVTGAGGFQMQRETFKDGVFRPFHRPPTMTLDEYAAREMEKLKAREEREKAAPPPIKSLVELAEAGLEDDVAAMDAATVKASKWEDWKDDHPKGAGVTKRY